MRKWKAAAFNPHPAQQLLMLVLNYLPLMQILVIAAVVVIPWAHVGWRSLRASLFSMWCPQWRPDW